MSPIHHLFCLLAACNAVLAAAGQCARADVLHSPQGYAVTIPNGWQTRHETHPNPDGFNTDMTYTHPARTWPLFRVEVDPQGRATMRNAAAMQAAFVRTKMPGFQVIEQRIRRVVGSPASETAAGGLYHGQPVLLDMIFTIHNGRNYTITLITTPKTLKPDLATFERILSTLRWTQAA